MSGSELCRRLRGDSRVPVVVSARSSDVDQVRGLSLGAGDFITKPFSLAVLLAKVRRALERGAGDAPAAAGGGAGSQGPGGEDDFDDGRLRVEPPTGRTYLNGRELHPTADRILRHLVANRGAVCTKENAIRAVRGDVEEASGSSGQVHAIRAVRGDELTSVGTLTVHVRRLRARIEKTGSPAHIRTVQGRGRLFEAP